MRLIMTQNPVATRFRQLPRQTYVLRRLTRNSGGGLSVIIAQHEDRRTRAIQLFNMANMRTRLFNSITTFRAKALQGGHVFQVEIIALS